MNNTKVFTNNNCNEMLSEKSDNTVINSKENKVNICSIESGYANDNKFVIDKFVSELPENEQLFKTNDVKATPSIISPSISANITTTETTKTVTRIKKTSKKINNCFITPSRVPLTLSSAHTATTSMLNAWSSIAAINRPLLTNFNSAKFNNNNNLEINSQIENAFKIKNNLNQNWSNEKTLPTNNNTENIDKNQNFNFCTNNNSLINNMFLPIFNKNNFFNNTLAVPQTFSLIMSLLQYNKQNQLQALFKQQNQQQKNKQNYNNCLNINATTLLKSQSFLKKNNKCLSQLNIGLNKISKKQFNIKNMLSKCDLNQLKQQQQLLNANLFLFIQKLNETSQKTTKTNGTKFNNDSIINFNNFDNNKSFESKEVDEISNQHKTSKQKFKIFSIKERQNGKEIPFLTNDELQASTSTKAYIENLTQPFNAVIYDGENELKKSDKIEISPTIFATCQASQIESEANFCGNSKRVLKKICRGDELVMHINSFHKTESENPLTNQIMNNGLDLLNQQNLIKLNKSKWQTKSKELCEKWSLEYGGESIIPTFSNNIEYKKRIDNIVEEKALNPITNESTNEQHTEKDSNGFQCERCGKMFSYAYYRDKHLKYTRCVDNGDRKFPCTLCTRSFEKRDRLRIHVLHVHENHRPHVCTVCDKAFSQSSSLNKHLRVHSGERPYHCPFCTKCFTASSILRTHIRQHSGEKPFKCIYCGKSFASHAAHDSHVRRTHNKEKLTGEKTE